MGEGQRELQLQREIVQSVRKERGWGRKLAHRTLVGLPDLLLVHYPFVPLLCEVKDLGPRGASFNVTIPVTEKQRHELRTYDEAIETIRQEQSIIDMERRYSAVLLVGWVTEGHHRLAMLPWHAERITSTYPHFVIRQKAGYYPFNDLAYNFGRLHRVKVI